MPARDEPGARGEDPGIGLRLSLVIPAFNEERRLRSGMARLTQAVGVGAIDASTTEFIVVDDGSTDATTPRALELLSAYPHVRSVRFERNRGKGAAVRAGVAAARAPSIAFADADMAIDPEQTPRFMEALGAADLAIGSRAATGASVDRPSISRSVMNRVFNRAVNIVTDVSLDDTQCGFKAFRAPAAKLLFHCTVTERMAFDVEVLTLARRLGLTIEQVPVHWLRVKGSRVRSWSDSRSMLRDVVRARRTGDAAPDLPGFVVDVPGGAAHAAAHRQLRQLARLLPVIRRADGRCLVLCPLMSDAAVTAFMDETGRSLGGSSPEPAVVPLNWLRYRAPLRLSWDDEPVILPAR